MQYRQERKEARRYAGVQIPHSAFGSRCRLAAAFRLTAGEHRVSPCALHLQAVQAMRPEGLGPRREQSRGRSESVTWPAFLS